MIGFIFRYGAMLAWSVFCISIISCSAYVQGIQPPIDQIPDDILNDESQIDFLVRGVQSRFADSYTDMVLYSGGLSDELFFDARTGAGGLVIFEEIDRALSIDRANPTLLGVQNRLGVLRFHADDAVRRAGVIQFSSGSRGDSLRRRLVFNGYFFGAVARYFYATYIGLNKREGGGTINNGAFIPSMAMYDSAAVFLQRAKENAPSDYDARLASTLTARIRLFQGQYAEARAAAMNGLRQGDAELRALYSLQMLNQVWNNAGLGRNVYIVDRRFDTLYLRQEPTDTARIRLRQMVRSGFTFMVQIKYPEQTSPIPFASWRENELILAECEVRANNNAHTPSALTRLNAVRSAYPGLRQLPATTLLTLDVIYAERDKELFCTGMRLPDQRRFNRWHLGATTWQYIPIVQSEINNNPHLPPLIHD